MNEKEIKDKLKKEIKEEIKKEVLEEIQEEKNNSDSNFEKKAKETIDKIMDTEDNTSDYDKKDIEANKGLAMICYIGPLVLIPFLISKDSKYVQYHAKQGLNLLVIEMMLTICSYFVTSIVKIPKLCTVAGTTYECGIITPWWISVPLSLIETVIGIIAIIGLVYACQGKAKELPLVGGIKIIK